MSAPGPSGTRPEHLRELVAQKDRRTASALTKAIGKFVHAAVCGKLPQESRWIMDSRLCYLAKKDSSTPRPVRVGELWRRVVGKQLVHLLRARVQALCMAGRQFGVCLPGGAEGLIHWRTQLERELERSSEVRVVIDVDVANAYPSLEWSCIREAVAEKLPELLP